MAIVTGPLLSLDASGKIAGSIVFSKWKGRPVVRQLVIPSNPQSQAQWGQRAMMRFLSQAWATLSDGDRALWQTLADAGKFSPFNAYTRYNLGKWTQFVTPYITPGHSSGTNPVMGALTVTNGVGQFDVSQVITTANNCWGVLFTVDPVTGYTPGKQNTRWVQALDSSPVQATITKMLPGTYFVRASGFTTGGSKTAFVAEQTVNVT